MLQYILISFLLFACNTENNSSISESYKMNPNQKKYWYGGQAEISSYQLSQARYGEMRDGKAVMVFVTEPFSPKLNTKSDHQKKDDVSVLKLNFTKKFNTGIYPYSMMTSSFFPFENGKHSLKISSSSQEWCGHTYMEMRKRKQLEFNINSYFEGESIKELKLDKQLIEDDIWSMIRLNPQELPTGKKKVIPSFFYMRMAHQELKASDCELSLNKLDDEISSYTLNFPKLNRSLSIQFESSFPHVIQSWEESYIDGFGQGRKKLTTTGKLIKTIKSDYWNKNSNRDAGMRKELGLE